MGFRFNEASAPRRSNVFSRWWGWGGRAGGGFLRLAATKTLKLNIYEGKFRGKITAISTKGQAEMLVVGKFDF